MSVPGLGELAAAVVALLTVIVTVVLIPRMRRRGEAEAAKAESDAAKAKSDEARAKSDAAAAAIKAISLAALPSVMATQQVFAGPLTEASPNPGTLSTEQARLARADAIRRMVVHFGDGQIDAMCRAIGCDRAGLETIMQTHLEAAKLTLATQPPAEYRLLIPRTHDTVELTATDLPKPATATAPSDSSEILR